MRLHLTIVASTLASVLWFACSTSPGGGAQAGTDLSDHSSDARDAVEESEVDAAEEADADGTTSDASQDVPADMGLPRDVATTQDTPEPGDAADAETDAAPDAPADAEASDVPIGEDDTSGDPRDADPDDVTADTGVDTDPVEFDAADASPDATDPGCPPEMARVVIGQGDVCVDRWEASLVIGDGPEAELHPFNERPTGPLLRAVSRSNEHPQAYISGVEASAACVAAGKRLCSSEEWLAACSAGGERVYPYVGVYDETACNVFRAVHPVLELFGAGAPFSSANMNDPRLVLLSDTLDRTGANERCVTPEGVFDLHGNLNEWVSDPDGTMRGGFFVNASINGAGCNNRTTAHNLTYHDYSIGFRCCRDAE